nr:probable carbohydrate esterase At4g34215 [Ipomoea batatas]
MVYFWWIMSPEELILDLELHKQHIKQKQVFILAGQSNMLGRGGVTKTTSYSGEQIKVWDGVVPPESHPNPAVFRLDGELRWELAREPLSHGIYCKITCGVGIGMAFANRLLEMDPNFGVVGLVPSAAGGTSITNWSGDAFNKPYKVLAKRAKFAVKSGGNLRAIFWYQGETDTRWSRNAKHYKIHLQKFIHKIRNDLGLPTLPFYQVIIPRLKKPFQGPYVEEVRKAQMETNATNLIKIEAEGLPIGADGVHLTTEGSMLAEKTWPKLSLWTQGGDSDGPKTMAEVERVKTVGHFSLTRHRDQSSLALVQPLLHHEVHRLLQAQAFVLHYGRHVAGQGAAENGFAFARAGDSAQLGGVGAGSDDWGVPNSARHLVH